MNSRSYFKEGYWCEAVLSVLRAFQRLNAPKHKKPTVVATMDFKYPLIDGSFYTTELRLLRYNTYKIGLFGLFTL